MSLEEEASCNFGVSWTISEDIASFFANMYGHNYDTLGKPTVIKQLTINKKDVVAYFNDTSVHSEKEVIYIHK